MLDKKQLTLEDIESQTTLELPNRELPALVNVTLVNVDLLSGNQVAIPIAAAVNVCNLSVAALIAIAQAGGSCEAVAGSSGENR